MLKSKTCSKEDLFSVPVPRATETYVPVSNKRLITSLESMVKDAGYRIATEEYSAACNGRMMIGKIGLETDHPEVGMMLAIGNSYNKTRRVTIAAGAVVFACMNGMFKGEVVTMRKHTGHIDLKLEDLIAEAIGKVEENYRSLLVDTELLKSTPVTKKAAAELLGDLYFNHQVLSSVQLNIIKDKMSYDKNFKMIEPEEMNLWNLYNNVTESLKISHPAKYIKNHRVLHSYLTDYATQGQVSENVYADAGQA